MHAYVVQYERMKEKEKKKNVHVMHADAPVVGFEQLRVCNDMLGPNNARKSSF